MTAINECIPILSKGTDIDMVNEGISAIPSADQLKNICGLVTPYFRYNKCHLGEKVHFQREQLCHV